MKKLRIAVAALVIAAGSFAAFAFTKVSPEVKDSESKLTTYYAVRIGTTSNFTWTDDPDQISENDLDCGSLNGASCEVLAASKPADNQMPPGQTPTHQAYQ